MITCEMDYWENPRAELRGLFEEAAIACAAWETNWLQLIIEKANEMSTKSRKGKQDNGEITPLDWKKVVWKRIDLIGEDFSLVSELYSSDDYNPFDAIAIWTLAGSHCKITGHDGVLTVSLTFPLVADQGGCTWFGVSATGRNLRAAMCSLLYKTELVRRTHAEHNPADDGGLLFG